ncbi:MAG: sugar phosphate isomerase/epimerase family protein [Planctomycetota bacterium]|jgi:hexulose-6-phosphate isomerase
MKKGICLACVPGASDAERYANAAEFGFEGVEVGTLRDAAERRAHKELSAKHGLAVCSVMNCDHWEYPLSDGEAAVRERSIECVAASIETAADLGADTVLVVPAVVTPEVTYEQAYERSAESVRRLLPLAEQRRVTLGIENVWNKFLLSPLEFAEYVDGFGSEYVGAYFDVGNIVAYGYPDHWIRTLGGRIRKVHVKGFDADKHAFVQLLEGTIDWPRVAGALRDIGYDDYVTAELGPAGGDPVKGLERISSEMDEILAMRR